MMNYAYIIGDKSTKLAAIVDPGWEAERLIAEVEKEGFSLAAILATHTHFDHVNELAAIAGKTGCRVYVHDDEAVAFSDLPNVVKVKDGDIVSVGDQEIKVMHTPGHTVGSVCYVAGNALFTGDTLFIDGIGRTDLQGGDSEQMYRSMAKIKTLPDKVIVFPGHNYGSAATATLGEQKKTNAYLACNAMSDFLRIV